MKTDLDYNKISQSISSLNLHAITYNKFNHTWDQKLYELDKPTIIKNRARKMVKVLRDQLTEIATNQNSQNDSSFLPTFSESNSSSMNSKKSQKKIILNSRLGKQFSIMSKQDRPESKNIEKHANNVNDHFLVQKKNKNQNPLSSSLDELDCKLKIKNFNNISEIFPQSHTHDIDDYKELFSINDVLSNSTLIKIKELEDKAKQMRDDLKKIEIENSNIISQTRVKRNRALNKIRATQYFLGNRKARNARFHNTLKFK